VKKRYIITIIVGGLLIGMGIIGSIMKDKNEPIDSSIHTKQELEAIKFVQSYQGLDNSGSNVTKIIATITSLAYSNEDIINNPSTEMGWDSLRKFDSDKNTYDVYFNFNTYNQDVEYHFIADMDSKQVFPANEIASNILKVVENES